MFPFPRRRKKNSACQLIRKFPVSKLFENQLKKSPRRSRFLFSILQEKLQLTMVSFVFLASLISLVSLVPLLHLVASSVPLVPLIVLSSPILKFVWWTSSICFISLLSDQLINSSTPFKEVTPNDSQDVDEFDEDAPPPVKNIKISCWNVFIKVMKMIFGVRSARDRHEGGILRLWDGDIIEVLALTSVLCFTDREGPISNVITYRLYYYHCTYVFLFSRFIADLVS